MKTILTGKTIVIDAIYVFMRLPLENLLKLFSGKLSYCPVAYILWLQVLTQEDWNIVLFAGMERTSHWAALYFVALMTFGNYVLFNLLVAILVEGFSNQARLLDFLVYSGDS